MKVVFRLYFDFEKLETWLNEMAAKGWMLQNFFAGLFTFSKGIPGEYIYRVELLKHMAGSPKNRPYLHFMEELGAEHIGSWVRWSAYRRKACDGAFDIYTDTDLRATHYRRISRFLLFFGCLEVLFGLLALFPLIHDAKVAWPGVLFAFFVGLAFLRVAARFYKKYRSLKAQKGLYE